MDQWNFATMFLCKGRPPFGTRTSIPAEPRVVGTESTKSPDGSLQMMLSRATPASTPWFLDSRILPIGGTAPCRGL